MDECARWIIANPIIEDARHNVNLFRPGFKHANPQHAPDSCALAPRLDCHTRMPPSFHV